MGVSDKTVSMNKGKKAWWDDALETAFCLARGKYSSGGMWEQTRSEKGRLALDYKRCLTLLLNAVGNQGRVLNWGVTGSYLHCGETTSGSHGG